MAIVIFHNPRCSKSRQTLQLIRDTGQEPTVIDYLKEGWTRPQLLALFAVAGITAREALRPKQDKVDPDADEDRILDAMTAHPELVERPLVCAPKGVRICRPPETVRALL